MIPARRWPRRAYLLALVVGPLYAGAAAVGGPEAPAGREPTREGLEELGRRLFFDPAASRLGMRSCADCHDPDRAFSDPRPRSPDDFGPTRRHSQTLVDVAYAPNAHWDGEFKDVRALVSARLEAPDAPVAYYGAQPAREAEPLPPVDPGPLASPAIRIVRSGLVFVTSGGTQVLARSGRYREAFAAVFGSPEPTSEAICTAVAEFCHSIEGGDSAFDRIAQGECEALTPAEKRGLALFRGRAGCASCHTMNAVRSPFTDYDLHDTGLPGAGASPFPSIRGPVAIRGLKTPTLRDVARRAPYFHDGSAATLEAAVRHYVSGAPRAAGLDPLVPTMVATDAEVADLVAFLRALTSGARPGAARVAWGARATTTRLRVLDAAGAPLAHLSLALVAAGDALPASGGLGDPAAGPRAWALRRTDADGRLEYDVPSTTHVRLVFDGDLAPEGGCWIPDTCADAVVRLPVRGTARLKVVARAGTALPAVLEAEHRGGSRFAGQRAPRTLFRRTGEPTLEGGRALVGYEALFRTDVVRSVVVRVKVGASTREVPVRIDDGEAATVDLTR